MSSTFKKTSKTLRAVYDDNLLIFALHVAPRVDEEVKVRIARHILQTDTDAPASAPLVIVRF